MYGVDIHPARVRFLTRVANQYHLPAYDGQITDRGKCHGNHDRDLMLDW